MYRHTRNEAIELLLGLAAEHALTGTTEGYYLGMGYYQSAQVVASVAMSGHDAWWPAYTEWVKWLRTGVSRHA